VRNTAEARAATAPPRLRPLTELHAAAENRLPVVHAQPLRKVNVPRHLLPARARVAQKNDRRELAVAHELLARRERREQRAARKVAARARERARRRLLVQVPLALRELPRLKVRARERVARAAVAELDERALGRRGVEVVAVRVGELRVEVVLVGGGGEGHCARGEPLPRAVR
jgi:hypothetical protein